MKTEGQKIIEDVWNGKSGADCNIMRKIKVAAWNGKFTTKVYTQGSDGILSTTDPTPTLYNVLIVKIKKKPLDYARLIGI